MKDGSVKIGMSRYARRVQVADFIIIIFRVSEGRLTLFVGPDCFCNGYLNEKNLQTHNIDITQEHTVTLCSSPLINSTQWLC